MLTSRRVALQPAAFASDPRARIGGRLHVSRVEAERAATAKVAVLEARGDHRQLPRLRQSHDRAATPVNRPVLVSLPAKLGRAWRRDVEEVEEEALVRVCPYEACERRGVEVRVSATAATAARVGGGGLSLQSLRL